MLEQPQEHLNRQEAVFFYAQNPELGVGTKIFSRTQQFIDHYKIQTPRKPFLVAQCQLLEDGTLRNGEDIEKGDGPIITLTHSGKSIHAEDSVWSFIVARPMCRDEFTLMSGDGMYVLQKSYNQQGKLVAVSHNQEVAGTWQIIEACLATEDSFWRMGRLDRTEPKVVCNEPKSDIVSIKPEPRVSSAQPSKLVKESVHVAPSIQFLELLVNSFESNLLLSRTAKNIYEDILIKCPNYEKEFQLALDEHRRGKSMSREQEKWFGYVEQLKEQVGIESDMTSVIERTGRQILSLVIEHLEETEQHSIRLGSSMYVKTYFEPLVNQCLYREEPKQHIYFMHAMPGGNNRLAGRPDYLRFLQDVLISPNFGVYK